MTLGFIGTGALTSAIVAGLRSASATSVSILLSPRNEHIAATLASRYPDVRVATDNQAVLDGCDTIMLAVPPQVVLELLPQLHFRRNHHVVTLITTVPREDIAMLVHPAERVTKAVPIPMIAHRQGAAIICPSDPEVAALFGSLGKVIEVADSAEFAALSVATATFAVYFKYLDTIHGWLTDHGVADSTARDYITALFKALANAPEKSPDVAFMDLAAEYATRGGINEQVLRAFTSRNVFDVLTEALDGVHQRIAGAAPASEVP